MSDPMELVGRLEGNAKQTITRYCGDLDGAIVPHALLTEAAACIRELVEQKPFAYFQWNEGWKLWEQVIPEASGQPHVVAAYRLPPAPGAEDE
ncbi:hypothetical protein ACFPIF_15790 [Brevundimonas faecalis]|uniref:hypothetical protein n=1 Tax=Brevundimonas faecalis TaxID=947378 RepID=UPI003622F0CF